MSANIDSCDAGDSSKSLSDLVEVLDSKTENVERLCIELPRIESGMQHPLLRDALKNSHSLINSLPDEILAKIIRIMVSVVLKCERGIRTPIRAANKCASVCRRWRLVILHDVFLWTNIRLSGNATLAFESAPEYFARSKSAQISLTVEMTESLNMKMPELMTVISAQASRICSFELQVDNWAYRLPEHLPGLSLPHMEDLTITCHRRQDPTALPRFFSDNLSSLRTLNVQHFTSWPLGLFVNLSTLRLEYRNIWLSISLSLFLDVLDGSPSLSLLSIVDHGPAVLDGVQSGRISSLPQLCKLDLSDCDSFVILSHIRVQPSTIVTVSNPLSYLEATFLRDLRSTSFSGLLRTIPQDLSQLGMWSATDAISFDICVAETFSFLINCDNGKHHGIEIVENISGLDFKDEVVGLLESVLRSIWDHLPSPSVTSFSLRCDYPTEGNFMVIPTLVWIRVFDNFPNLNKLVLHECVTTNVLNSLRILNPDDGDGVAVLPGLRRLELKLHVPATASEKLVALLRGLEDLLQFRHGFGAAINDLKVEFWYRIGNDGVDEGICELPSGSPARLQTWKRSYGVNKLELIHNKVAIYH